MNPTEVVVMSNIKFAMSVAVLGAVSLCSSYASAWGGSHSFAAAGVHGGSIQHTGGTTVGYHGYEHSGSTTVTTPDGQTYTGSHEGGAVYGPGGVAYGGHYSGSTSGGWSYNRSYGGRGATYYGYNGCSYPVGGCYGTGFGAGLVTGAAAANAQNQQINYDTQIGYNSNINYTTPPSGVYQAPKPEY